MDLIENQVFPPRALTPQVIGRSEALLDTCLRSLHYALVALCVRLQTAVAYLCLIRPRQV